MLFPRLNCLFLLSLCLLSSGIVSIPVDVDPPPDSFPTLASTSTDVSTVNDVGPVGKLPSLANAKLMPLQNLLVLKPRADAPLAEREHFNLLFCHHPRIVNLPYDSRNTLASSIADIYTQDIKGQHVKGAFTRHLKHYFEHDRYIPENDRKDIKNACVGARLGIASNKFQSKTDNLHSENPAENPSFVEYIRKNQRNCFARKAATKSGAKNLFYFLKQKYRIEDGLSGRELELATRPFKDIYGKKRRAAYVSDLVEYMVDKKYPLSTIEDVKRIREKSLSEIHGVNGHVHEAGQASLSALPQLALHALNDVYDQAFQDNYHGQYDLTSTFPGQSSWGQTWHGTSSSSHGNIGVASNTFNPPHLPDTYDWGGDYIYDPAQQFNFSPPTANNMDMTDGYLAHLGLGPENLRDDLQYLPSSMGSYNPGAIQNLDQYLYPMHLGYESAQPHASSLPVPNVIHQQQQHHTIEDHSQVPFTYYANPYSLPAVEMPPEFLHQSHQMPHTLKSQGHFSLSRHQ